MMKFVTHLHFAAFFIYLVLALFILWRDRRSPLNLNCTAVLLCFSVWSFCMTFVHHPEVPRGAALVFEKAGSLGWTFFAAFFFRFAAHLAGSRRLLSNRVFWTAAFGAAMLFFLSQCINPFFEIWKLTAYGWDGRWTASAWTLSFLLYYSALVVWGLVLIFLERRRSPNPDQRRILSVLLFAAMGSMVSASVSNVALDLAGLDEVPPLGDVLVLLFAAGLGYTSIKYRFLNLAPVRLTDTEAMWKKTEQELVATEERLKIMFENAPDGWFVYDLKGTFLDGNRRAEEIVGFKKEELVGKSFLNLDLLPTDQLLKAGKLLGMNALGHASGPDEFTLKRKDGSFILVEISSHPMHFGTKRVCLGIVRDIGERKKSETEKNRLEEELRHVQKLESLGQLAGGVAHDFNNIISAISGFAEIMKMKYSGKGDPRLDQYVDMILDAAKQAGELTQRLLAFSRKSKRQSAVLEFHGLVDNLVKILEHTFDRRITVVTRLHAQRATVTGDASLLQNVLMNLAVNARDAMPEGGKLVFATGNADLTGAETAAFGFAVEPGSYLVADVTDTGTGMDEATLKRCFEPFFTTKEMGKGTGLGLASVYGTVKDHKGYVRVFSEKGKGTTFRVYLPVSQLALEEAKDAAAGQGRYAGTVLVVDDEPGVRVMVQGMLEILGFKVLTCADGEEAVACYREHHGRIRLVVSDVIMPRLDGRGCLRRLREINPAVKAVFMSGFMREGEQDLIASDGAAGFLSKPFTFEQLSQAVEKALGR